MTEQTVPAQLGAPPEKEEAPHREVEGASKEFGGADTNSAGTEAFLPVVAATFSSSPSKQADDAADYEARRTAIRQRVTLTLDDVFVEAALTACMSASSKTLEELGDICVKRMEDSIAAQNRIRKVAGHANMPTFFQVQPSQAAMILSAKFEIRHVIPGGTGEDDGQGVLAVYQTEGEFEGTYHRADAGLLEGLASELRPHGNRDFHHEVERALLRTALKVQELSDKDLIPMADCWYNYATRERLPFSPELVTLSKFATRLPESAPAVPTFMNDDGSTWDAISWFASVAPDPETAVLMFQIGGMCLRPGVDWRVLVYLLGEGLNGKGTFIELLRALVGPHLVTNIAPSKFSDRFSLGTAISKRLNLVDEDDVGEFITKAAVLKQVVSRDPVLIERKHRDPISARLMMSTIVSLNDVQKFRDKTEAMDDRQVYISFPQRFAGVVKNERIKNEYVVSDPVREWFAYKVLVELPRYYRITESASAKATKAQARSESDKVLAFAEAYGNGDEFQRDFLPFEMLHSLFVARERRLNPGGAVEGATSFTKRLKKFIGPEWVVPQGGNGKDKELGLLPWLFGEEPALDEFDEVPDVSRWTWHRYPETSLGSPSDYVKKKRKARGFVRRTAWERFEQTGATPQDDAYGQTP